MLCICSLLITNILSYVLHLFYLLSDVLRTWNNASLTTGLWRHRPASPLHHPSVCVRRARYTERVCFLLLWLTFLCLYCPELRVPLSQGIQLGPALPLAVRWTSMPCPWPRGWWFSQWSRHQAAVMEKGKWGGCATRFLCIMFLSWFYLSVSISSLAFPRLFPFVRQWW